MVELLTVIGIMAILTAIAIPAVIGMSDASKITQTAYDIAGTLDQARAYAMANNTYVFVGIAEVDASVSASASPQVTSSSTPYGRVAIAVVASKDGTPGYDTSSSSLSSPAWTSYSNGANLVAISRLQHFEDAHLGPLFETIPNTGKLTRPIVSDAPVITGGTSYIIGNSNCQSVTPFTWPLGSALGAGSGQYYFTKVINFDPQGAARIQDPVDTTTIVSYMEIGLQQTHGNNVSSSPNVAAIQIDGITGAVHVYRP